MLKPVIVVFTFLLSWAASIGQSVNWPGYRGPSDDGHSPAKNVPLDWSDTKNIVWRTTIPGRGWSSPVVMDGQVWVTTSEPDGKKLKVISLKEKDGSIQHNIDLFDIEFPQEQHGLNSYASPSPVIEPGRIYVHFGAYGTACIDTKSGKVIWKRKDLQCDHGVGPGSSPFLYQDLLILTFDGQDLQYLIALDKKTGKTVWNTPRGIDFSSYAPDTRKAFSTPIVVKVDGKDQLISPGPHVIMALEPLTGKEIWRVRYEGFSASARPVTGNGMVFFNTGFSLSSVIAVKLAGTGDKTSNALVWLNKRNLAARSSPLFVNGLLFMVNTAGQAKCIDPANGNELWSERVGQETSASPVYAGGRIYTFDESGFTTVFLPQRTFVKVTENQLPDGFMASPAVVDGGMYLRTKKEVIRIKGG
jgi:outer membrane protein assembly factor BamB